MHQAKIAAFFEEFPFLKDYVSRDWPDDIRVKRVDGNLWRTAVGDSKRILLLDRTGRLIAEVGKPWWDCRRWFEKTAEDALARLGTSAGCVHYILERWCGQTANYVVIHKPPKGFTIVSWCENELRQTRDVLRNDLECIDAVATGTDTKV